MYLGVALLWPLSNHRKQGWKGPREDFQPVSFKARPALVKLFHPSASFRLQSHNTEGQGRLTKFHVSLWFLFILKTLTGSGVVLELLYIADSGRIAETSVTFPFPSGDWRLLPDSSEAKSSECYLRLQHINLDKHSTISLSVVGFARVLRVCHWIWLEG